MSTIFFRTPYNYSMYDQSLKTGLSCKDKTLAQQNSRDECDINVIMAKFGKGQALPENFKAPQYGDFSAISDYQTALNAVRSAGESFMEMPAQLRARFNNDPNQLMSFLDNSDNRAEAQKLGILPPPPVVAPVASPEALKTAPITPAKQGLPKAE